MLSLELPDSDTDWPPRCSNLPASASPVFVVQTVSVVFVLLHLAFMCMLQVHACVLRLFGRHLTNEAQPSALFPNFQKVKELTTVV